MTPTESMPGAQGVTWIRIVWSRMPASQAALIGSRECDLHHSPLGAAPPGGGHGGRRVAHETGAAEVKISKARPPPEYSASVASSFLSAAAASGQAGRGSPEARHIRGKRGPCQG